MLHVYFLLQLWKVIDPLVTSFGCTHHLIDRAGGRRQFSSNWCWSAFKCVFCCCYCFYCCYVVAALFLFRFLHIKRPNTARILCGKRERIFWTIFCTLLSVAIGCGVFVLPIVLATWHRHTTPCCHIASTLTRWLAGWKSTHHIPPLVKLWFSGICLWIKNYFFFLLCVHNSLWS